MSVYILLEKNLSQDARSIEDTSMTHFVFWCIVVLSTRSDDRNYDARESEPKAYIHLRYIVPRGLGNSLFDMRELLSQRRHWRRPVKIAKRHRFVVKRCPNNGEDVISKENRIKKTVAHERCCRGSPIVNIANQSQAS